METICCCCREMLPEICIKRMVVLEKTSHFVQWHQTINNNQHTIQNGFSDEGLCQQVFFVNSVLVCNIFRSLCAQNHQQELLFKCVDYCGCVCRLSSLSWSPQLAPPWHVLRTSTSTWGQEPQLQPLTSHSM